MIDQRSSPGTTCGDPHPAATNQINDFRNGQEVPSEPEFADRGEFSRQPILSNASHMTAVPLLQCRFTPGAHQRVEGLRIARTQHDVSFRDKDATEPKIASAVDRTCLSELTGARQQGSGIPLTGSLRECILSLRKRRTIELVVLRTVRRHSRGIQRHEEPGRVEHISSSSIFGRTHTHRIRQHHW